jgi:hypothetical protein
VWTMSSNGIILLNGQNTGGYGTQILWFGGQIYVLGGDNNWWAWTQGRWSGTGPIDPSTSGSGSGGGSSASPNGTRVPTTATAIIDNNSGRWTISNGFILLNGQNTNGWGTQILWFGGSIYVLGGDSYWWKWSGGWSRYSQTDPSR